MNALNIKQLQTAVASQEGGNNIYGAIGLRGGFACTSSGGVLGPVIGPFNVVPGPAIGEPAGVYRVYPLAPGPTAGTYIPYSGAKGTITGIDFFNVNAFTPRAPGVSETASALVTGYNTDAANGQWYITVQISTLTTGAILATPPNNFVVGVEVAVSLSPSSNPL